MRWRQHSFSWGEAALLPKTVGAVGDRLCHAAFKPHWLLQVWPGRSCSWEEAAAEVWRQTLGCLDVKYNFHSGFLDFRCEFDDATVWAAQQNHTAAGWQVLVILKYLPLLATSTAEAKNSKHWLISRQSQWWPISDDWTEPKGSCWCQWLLGMLPAWFCSGISLSVHAWLSSDFTQGKISNFVFNKRYSNSFPP